MGTKILNDIHCDLKLLITTITGYEEGEEGFRICERFALSNLKHHRYLSVDGHATKRAIEGVAEKFWIHGKYDVAKRFRELVSGFLESFDFQNHPQYDLQWSLLSLLLNLSSETNKSDLASLENLRTSRGEHSFNITVANENEVTEGIDWGQYLKEGQEDFFCHYDSDTESEWTDDEESESRDLSKRPSALQSVKDSAIPVQIRRTQSVLDKLSHSLAGEVESRNWLVNNVQNTWWKELDWSRYLIDSRFPDADLCDLWDRAISKGIKLTGTLSEYQMCRELLWMCHVQTQMVVFQQKNEVQFFIAENVSIPSLTTSAFNSILLPFCECFSMIREIEKFGESLHPKHRTEEECKLPPLTYEAYNIAVTQHLAKLKNAIVELEKKFIKQEDCDTLLSLSKDLRKYTKDAKMIHEVHRAVTYNWEVCLNWKCASKLLSGLFFEMQNSSSREKSNLCASLYLQSIRVYLNIIDTWLSEGRFEDWREEFVIAKVLDDVTIEDGGQQRKFIVRQLDSICLADPIMQLLVHKVRHMGRSIELLVSLDRVPDMWRMVNDNDAARVTLKDEFLDAVMAGFSKYNFSDSLDVTDTPSDRIRESQLIIPADSDIEQSVLQQISKLDNPFLMKAFEEYLPVDIFRKDTVDARSDNNDVTVRRNADIFEWLESISESVLPTRIILESTLSRILDLRYKGASKLVKDIMLHEYKLEAHMKLMRCVYMMGTGHVMSKFYQLLFNEVESNPMWNNSYFLTNILEEILSQEWPDSSSRWSIVVQDVRTSQVLQAVDHINLHYAIGWPVSMVLNEDSLERYNGIFRFQLKLKWALWTLDNLRFSDLEGSKSTKMIHKMQHFHVRRLECLRFWLIHAIGSIHAYLSGQVLQSLGSMLEKSLTEADSLDTILSVHNDYLEKVHEHCLQTLEFEDLTATINSMLEMCLHVRDRWNRGAAALIATELDLMENSYIKYHTYLALALHNAVQHKDANYYKLTPWYQIYTVDHDPHYSSDGNKIIDEHLSELSSRNLLTEVAHQSLPPSGIPVLIPKLTLIQRKRGLWEGGGSEIRLPEVASLNGYEQTFSYLRWYYNEERVNSMNSPAYFLCNVLGNFIKDEECMGYGYSIPDSWQSCRLIDQTTNSSRRRMQHDRQILVESENIEVEGIEQSENKRRPNEPRENSSRTGVKDESSRPKSRIENQLETLNNECSAKFNEANSKLSRNQLSTAAEEVDEEGSVAANTNYLLKSKMVHLETFGSKNSTKSNEVIFENVKKFKKSQAIEVNSEEEDSAKIAKISPRKNFIEMNRQLTHMKTEPKNTFHTNAHFPKSPVESHPNTPEKKSVKLSQISKFKQTSTKHEIPVKQSNKSCSRDPIISSGQDCCMTKSIKEQKTKIKRVGGHMKDYVKGESSNHNTKITKLSASHCPIFSKSRIPMRSRNNTIMMNTLDHSSRPTSQGVGAKQPERNSSSDRKSCKYRKNAERYERSFSPRKPPITEVLSCFETVEGTEDSSETYPHDEKEIIWDGLINPRVLRSVARENRNINSKNEKIKTTPYRMDEASSSETKFSCYKFNHDYRNRRDKEVGNEELPEAYMIKDAHTVHLVNLSPEKLNMRNQNMNRNNHTYSESEPSSIESYSNNELRKEFNDKVRSSDKKTGLHSTRRSRTSAGSSEAKVYYDPDEHHENKVENQMKIKMVRNTSNNQVPRCTSKITLEVDSNTTHGNSLELGGKNPRQNNIPEMQIKRFECSEVEALRNGDHSKLSDLSLETRNHPHAHDSSSELYDSYEQRGTLSSSVLQHHTTRFTSSWSNLEISKCSLNMNDSRSTLASYNEERTIIDSNERQDTSCNVSYASNEVDAETQCAIDNSENEEKLIDLHRVSFQALFPVGLEKFPEKLVTFENIEANSAILPDSSINICKKVAVDRGIDSITPQFSTNTILNDCDHKLRNEPNTTLTNLLDLNVNNREISAGFNENSAETRHSIIRSGKVIEELMTSNIAGDNMTLANLNINISETPSLIDLHEDDSHDIVVCNTGMNTGISNPAEVNENTNSMATVLVKIDSKTKYPLQSDDSNTKAWTTSDIGTYADTKNPSERSFFNLVGNIKSCEQMENCLSLNSYRKLKLSEQPDFKRSKIQVYEKLRNGQNSKVSKNRCKSKFHLNVLYRRNCKVEPYNNGLDSLLKRNCAGSKIDSDATSQITFENHKNSTTLVNHSDIIINSILQNVSGNGTDSMTSQKYSSYNINKNLHEIVENRRVTNPMKSNSRGTHDYRGFCKKESAENNTSTSDDDLNGFMLRRTVEELNLNERMIHNKSSRDNNTLPLTSRNSFRSNRILLKLSPKDTVKCTAIGNVVNKSRNAVSGIKRTSNNLLVNNQASATNTELIHDNQPEFALIEKNISIMPAEKMRSMDMHTVPTKLWKNTVSKEFDDDKTISQLLAPRKQAKVSGKRESKESEKTEMSNKNPLLEQLADRRQSCILS